MEIFESTLRDGEQQALLHFSAQQKAELAQLFEKLGVDVIDAGFPAASQVDLEGVKLIAENTTNVKLSILSRPIKKDFELAYKAVKSAEKRLRIATSTKAYDLLPKQDCTSGSNYKKTIDKSCNLMSEARALFPEVQYYIVFAGNRDMLFLGELSEAVAKAGATHVVIADTLSTMEPNYFGSLVKYIKKSLPTETVLGVHCHNLLGLGLANSIAGIQNGATQVEVTIGNIGDSGGNTALEQILAYAKFFGNNDSRFSCNCQLYMIDEVTRKLLEFIKFQFSPNQPLIGANSFLVETGIHQSFPSEIINNTFNPEIVGRRFQTVIGRHSGISGITSKLETMNFNLSNTNLNILYKEVMKIAEQNGSVDDEKLREIASFVASQNF